MLEMVWGWTMLEPEAGSPIGWVISAQVLEHHLLPPALFKRCAGNRARILQWKTID